jgi:hypothetical protein
MAVLAMTLPLLPAKTEAWRHWTQEMAGTLLPVVCGQGSSRAVESDGLPPLKRTEQELQRRRWGLRRPAAPVTPQHDPGFQPASHRP